MQAETGAHASCPRASWRGGELLRPHTGSGGVDYTPVRSDEIVTSIRRVGKDGQIPEQTIRECIATLPAEEI